MFISWCAESCGEVTPVSLNGGRLAQGRVRSHVERRAVLARGSLVPCVAGLHKDASGAGLSERLGALRVAQCLHIVPLSHARRTAAGSFGRWSARTPWSVEHRGVLASVSLSKGRLAREGASGRTFPARLASSGGALCFLIGSAGPHFPFLATRTAAPWRSHPLIKEEAP